MVEQQLRCPDCGGRIEDHNAVTCIVLSLLLAGILWLVRFLSR